MLERGLNKEFTIQLSLRESIGKNNSLMSWIKVIRKAAKTEYIILDNFAPLFSKINLSKKTKLIQVWHAGVGFKNVGFARFGKTGSPRASGSVHQKYYKALAPAKSLVKVYEEVFGIEKEAFMPLGMPRLDNFFDEEKIANFKESFYKDYPYLKNKKLILFAPTYRGAGQKSAYYNYDKLNFDRIAEFCGDEYVFAIKMHPFTKDTPDYYEKAYPDMDQAIVSQRLKPDLSKYHPHIIDLTNQCDINDLFHITDILITDYSSAFYEFSILKKPILFFVYDRIIYENVRGVHQSIKEIAPGKVCDTFDELMSALESKDYDIEKTISFAEDNFDDNFGHATDNLIDALLFLENK
jgi:CDP-ribitol ribitolphosphotransferase